MTRVLASPGRVSVERLLNEIVEGRVADKRARDVLRRYIRAAGESSDELRYLAEGTWSRDGGYDLGTRGSSPPPLLKLTWNENEHIIVQSVNQDEDVCVELVVEEAGDAKNKVVHVHVAEQLQNSKVEFHT